MTPEKVGIYFIVGAVSVVALAIAGFAIGGPLAGLIVIICVVVGFLIGRTRFERGRRGQVEVASAPADDVRRLLVIANEGLGGPELGAALRERAGDRTHVYIVVPFLADPADRLAGDQDTRDAARADLERLVGDLEDEFDRVEGDVGDTDPSVALEDALRAFPADEVVVVNPPEGEKGRMEQAATRRAKQDVPLRVTELNVG